MIKPPDWATEAQPTMEGWINQLLLTSLRNNKLMSTKHTGLVRNRLRNKRLLKKLRN